MKTSSLKRQSPTSGAKNYVDIKSELQMALNPTKNNTKSYGAINTANNITKIYYSNKPDFMSNASYQRLPESPSSTDSVKKFSGGSNGKKSIFMRSSPGHNAQHQSREGSISSGSNSRTSPKPPDVAYQQLGRSRTRTPPKYLHLNPTNAKFSNMGGSNNSSPTKPPSASVLYHQSQAGQNMDWKQPPPHQHQRSGRSNSGSGAENKYRIQF